MKLSGIQLKNFKRFTDLTIEQVPVSAKLVLLIGSNGSGKSSVFDGFEVINKFFKSEGHMVVSLNPYYKKYGAEDFVITLIDNKENKITCGGGSLSLPSKIIGTSVLGKNTFYGRTSFRQVPQLTRISLGQNRFDIENDSDRPKLFIEKDNRFENDIEKITGIILKEFYRTENSKEKILEKYVQPINEALQNIFGKQNGTRLQLLEIIPPLDGNVAQINFSKGNSEVHYNNLSAGEKEVFNILINLLSRRDLYQDTIYFFDEIDLHLNTKIQYNLIKEITEHWIPDNCQLWTASHSLGFIDFANESENAVIIDFDDLDFDKPQVLSPMAKDKMEVFEIAVSKEFISKFVQDKKIIFSENSDTPFYNNLNLENTLFFNAIDKHDAFHKSINLKASALIDRDYLSDEERIQILETYNGVRILFYYSIENYFYHPNNLEEYYKLENKQFDKISYFEKLIELKNKYKSQIVYGIDSARKGYPFYKENENAKKKKSFFENGKSIIDLLESNDFEVYYKVFPAKDYGTTLVERQNLNKEKLAATQWFRNNIEAVLK